MKTSIKNLIAIVLTAFVLIGSTAVTNATETQNVTTLSALKKIKKITVAGNVELILVQHAEESIKVYDNYYAKNALVQQTGGELRISSFQKEVLTVVVYVNNLTEISASDNATVKTYGEFKTLALAVNLNDNATANLCTNTLELKAAVSGAARLTLTGNTENYASVMGNFAKVNMDAFIASNASIQAKSMVVAQVAESATMPESE